MAYKKCDLAMASVMPVVILLKLFMCHLSSSIPVIDIKKISDILNQFENNDFPWVIHQIVGEWENEVQTVNQVFVEDVHGGKSNMKFLTGMCQVSSVTSCPASQKCTFFNNCPNIDGLQEIVECPVPGSSQFGICCPQESKSSREYKEGNRSLPLCAKSTGIRSISGQKYNISMVVKTANLAPAHHQCPRSTLSADLLHLHQQPDPQSVLVHNTARGVLQSRQCQPAESISCEETDLYRSSDGSCNNLNNPSQGSRHSPYLRLLSPVYSDDDMNFRLSVDGSPLPSARLVSEKLTTVGSGASDGVLSVNVMQWGQFIVHDLDHTPEVKASAKIDCCGDDYQEDSCAPIIISPDDSFYGPHGKTCMNFIRSALSSKQSCDDNGEAEVDQQNQVTSYIDASMIYGSAEEVTISLRSFSGGKLSTGDDDLLEPSTSGECQPNTVNQDISKCFKSGDKRVNESPGLSLYHTLFHREHNRVAGKLAEYNPSWDDEQLFQQSRSIVIAQIQHINYNEYLPVILGPEYVAKITQDNTYDPSVDATAANSFATAAFRFGHSQIPEKLRMSSSGCPRSHLDSREFKNLFFNPGMLRKQDKFQESLSGLSDGAVVEPGPSFSSSVSGKLFIHRDSEGGLDEDVGLDLVAINIQRGRDHGLPGYNKFRALCQLEVATEFSDLSDTMSPEHIDKLKSVYNHVDDIDLYIAGLMETPTFGSLLGPTFSYIIANQMLRSRLGDRFFFSLENSASQFSQEQIEEIKKTSLSRIICDNSNTSKMQPNAFKTVSLNNPMVSCTDSLILEMDLSLWKQ